MKPISSADITKVGSDLLVARQIAALDVHQVRTPHEAHSHSLVFASKVEQFETAKSRGARAFIVLESLYEQIKNQIDNSMAVWTTQNIQRAMTVVLIPFDNVSKYVRQGIHPTAVIDPTAQVASTAHIGPYCVIGAYAKVGEHTQLTAHDYVGPFCEIGSHCIFAPFVSIGQDGFGFSTDKEFRHHKIPQIGKVVVEDHVEFGAHCAVDRATLSETRIKQGSKFDNYCHIAHNTIIGENALTAYGFAVAGSTTIGRNLIAAGSVNVTGHIDIADNVLLSGRAGVTNSIEKSGAYGGFPLETHIESVKTTASLPHIKILRKQVRKILKHLQLEEES